MGGAAAIDSGSASALAALAVSFNALLIGDCDTMICAAGQRRLAWPEFDMLARNTVCSPPNGQSAALWIHKRPASYQAKELAP